MNANFSQFELLDTKTLPAVEKIKLAFERKHELEKEIAKLIKQYEREYGLAIDMIKYQRDITIPLKSPRYTALSIIITAEE